MTSKKQHAFASWITRWSNNTDQVTPICSKSYVWLVLLLLVCSVIIRRITDGIAMATARLVRYTLHRNLQIVLLISGFKVAYIVHGSIAHDEESEHENRDISYPSSSD